MKISDLSNFLYRGQSYGGTQIPSKLNAIAIGWLGSRVPQKGIISPHHMQILKFAKENHHVDGGLLGYHRCKICKKHENRGGFIIQVNERNYILPMMVIHYIKKHSYLPPTRRIHDRS